MKKWFEGEVEISDACCLCIHGCCGDDTTRHDRIAAAARVSIDMLYCDGCPWQGSTGQVMPDDDPARVWMDEQAA